MTPALKTVGILVASGALVASSLLLTRAAAPPTVRAGVATASGSTGFLSAVAESSQVLRGLGESHVAVSITAPEAPVDQPRPEMAVAIVLDRSGSMEGDKLEQAKRAAAELIQSLDSKDKFSVTTYGDEATTILSLRSATDESVQDALPTLSKIREYGGTNIAAGIIAGQRELSAGVPSSSLKRIVLISDGLANDSRQTLVELAQRTQERAITVTTLGVGTDFDERTMTAIAVAGRGNYYFAERASDLGRLFSREFDRVSQTAATQVAITFTPADGIEVLQAYGHQLVGRSVTLANLHSGETRQVVFRIRGRYPDLGAHKLGTVSLSMKSVKGRLDINEQISLSVESTDDHHGVRRGQNKDAIGLIERARTALALDSAAELYESGHRAAALELLSNRRVEAKKRARDVGDEDLEEEMEATANDAAASFALEPSSEAGKIGTKRARGKAYDLLH